jgi:hypothetical protein
MADSKRVICLGETHSLSETVGFVLNQKVARPLPSFPPEPRQYYVPLLLGLDNNFGNNFDFLDKKNNFNKV